MGTDVSFASLQYVQNNAVQTERNFNWDGARLGMEYISSNEHAPSFGFQLHLPKEEDAWSATVNLSASKMVDPVIIDGSLAYTQTATAPIVSAGAGVGFVMNDTVSLRFDATQNMTYGELTVPSSNLGLSGSYRLNEQHSLTAGASVNLRNGSAQPRFSFGYVYRPAGEKN